MYYLRSRFFEQRLKVRFFEKWSTCSCKRRTWACWIWGGITATVYDLQADSMDKLLLGDDSPECIGHDGELMAKLTRVAGSSSIECR